MGEKVIWFDKAVADFSGESVLITAYSGEVAVQRRMSRASFREFIDTSARMLDALDRKPSTVKRFVRRKPLPEHA